MNNATDRLRERMQNEQTSLALSELLRNNRAELITLRDENAALREAAGKVTCSLCLGRGCYYPTLHPEKTPVSCPRCADLRKILEGTT